MHRITQRRALARRVAIASPQRVDLNFLFRIANFGVVVALIVQARMVSSSLYTNGWTVLLGVVLALVTHFALVAEKRRRNPLVTMLAFVVILFFSFRIFTLTAYPFSTTLSRFECSPVRLNLALGFIIGAVAALYLGLIVAAKRETLATERGAWRAASTGRIIIFLLLSLLMMYSPEGDTLWLISIVRSFFSQNLVIGTAITYIFIFYTSIPTWTRLTLVFLLAVEAGLHFLVGSRGSIYTLIICYLCSRLAISGRVQWSRRQAIVACLVFIAAVPLVLQSFLIATHIRNVKTAGALTLADSLAVAVDFVSAPDVMELEDRMIPVFDRLGYLDYSVDLIVNREKYHSVVTFSAYAKSIVDNLLTPGFDLFDQPRIANSLRSVYEGGQIRKSEVSEMYHTDQLGLPGEIYLLFGYAGVAVMFVIGFAAQMLYEHLGVGEPMVVAMKRYTMLIIFYGLINSYGLDWVLIDAVVLSISIYATSGLVYARRQIAIRRGGAERPLPPRSPVVQSR